MEIRKGADYQYYLVSIDLTKYNIKNDDDSIGR
jgi:hypothetical protein